MILLKVCIYHSHVSFLSTTEVPTIIASTDDVTVNEAATSFSLSCNYTGVPSPTVTWYKDSVQLSNSNPDKINIQTNQVTVYSVTETDEGVYQCRVVNEAGSNDANISVDVIRESKQILYVIAIVSEMIIDYSRM